MGKVRVNLEIDDKGSARRYGIAVARLDHDVAEVRREVGEDAELILAGFAPEETGRLARGIRAVSKGKTVELRANARDPETGYNYVPVTRFGHRVAIIYPGQRARSITSPLRLTSRGTVRLTEGPGARRDIFGGARALKTKFGYRAWVRGVRVSSDWVEDALPEIEAAAHQRLEQLGRHVAREVNG